MIPATMSTQHPDNASMPSWVKTSIFNGEDEVFETYYAYSKLGCQEQMWDWEGKEVDAYVVMKLLEKYPDFFSEKILGKDVRLTYRIPNPWVEISERKIFTEALQSITRAYDEANQFYKEPITPVYEVILPLTSSSRQVILTHKFYEKLIGGIDTISIEGVMISSIIGTINPKKINVIPLIEDMNSLLNAAEIIHEVYTTLQLKEIRVFFARSDPALNYGLIPAVLLVKNALIQVSKLSEKHDLNIYPIIGTGPPPFRGNLNPDNIDKFLEEYSGFKTVTIQSSFKYDYPFTEAKNAIEKINKELPKKQAEIDLNTDMISKIIKKLSKEYRKRIEKLAPLINKIANYVPSRRKRRLHIGLFGYSRKVGNTRLPRAIKFTAAMYTIGIPPELVGIRALNRLTEEELNIIEETYKYWRNDLQSAARYLSWDNINYLLTEDTIEKLKVPREPVEEALVGIMKDLEFAEQNLDLRLGYTTVREKKHSNAVNNALLCIMEGEDPARYIVEAGRLRRFLG